MAFGIDDALTAAATGIRLTDTLVKTVQAYKKSKADKDIEHLIEEVRVTALQRIDSADRALRDFERTLTEKGLDLRRTLQETINLTSFWQPFEQHRLKRIRRSFNALADAVYDATDDIAALVRCKDRPREMGSAVVESFEDKHRLFSDLLHAKSVEHSINLLRDQLKRYKTALAG